LTTDPVRQRTLLHQRIVRRTLQHNFLQAADSTAGITRWKVGVLNADTCLKSFDNIIHWYLAEAAAANALVQSLSIRRYMIASATNTAPLQPAPMSPTDLLRTKNPCSHVQALHREPNPLQKHATTPQLGHLPSSLPKRTPKNQSPGRSNSAGPRQRTLGDFLGLQPTNSIHRQPVLPTSSCSVQVTTSSNHQQNINSSMSAQAQEFTPMLRHFPSLSVGQVPLPNRQSDRLIRTKQVIPGTAP
jgi:hypothetical protein